MKRKVFVALIALVVVTAIVGSCFAAYVKEPLAKTITLTTGQAVTLQFVDINDNFVLGAGTEQNPKFSPDHSKTLSLTLDAGNVEEADDDIQGRFHVSITAATSAEKDIALAAAIVVTATGTKSNDQPYSADNETLRSQAGSLIDLEDIPTDITLTFTIAEENFADAAEGNVIITLSWTIVDNWAPDANTYYVATSLNGWSITRESPTLSTDPEEIGNNSAVLKNIEFTAGEEFKVVKGNTWYPLKEGSASITAGDVEIRVSQDESNGNCVVKTTRAYCIYQNDNGFYVGPYPENP